MLLIAKRCLDSFIKKQKRKNHPLFCKNQNCGTATSLNIKGNKSQLYEHSTNNLSSTKLHASSKPKAYNHLKSDVVTRDKQQKNQGCVTSTSSNSTLSLHITAYEAAFEPDNSPEVIQNRYFTKNGSGLFPQNLKRVFGDSKRKV